MTAAIQATETSSDEAAMKTSVNAFRDDRPTAGAPGAVRGAAAPLAPLLAGARARGVADGLELIGAAAALLDEQGEVLHLNARALSLLGDHLVLAGGRLRARDRALDRTLTAAIDSTVRHHIASRVALGDEATRRRPRREDHAGDRRSRRIRSSCCARWPFSNRASRPCRSGFAGLN